MGSLSSGLGLRREFHRNSLRAVLRLRLLFEWRGMALQCALNVAGRLLAVLPLVGLSSALGWQQPIMAFCVRRLDRGHVAAESPP